MRINYILPALRLTGGVRVIIEIADRLARRGHQVTVTAFGRERDLDWWPRPMFSSRFARRGRLHKYRVAAARRLLPGWHEQDEKIRVLAQRSPECDINVATASFTAFSVCHSGRGLPFHHMQHYDAVFYPDDPHAAKLAIDACALPVGRIANSRWLTGRLKEEHGITGVDLVYPAIEHEFFRPEHGGARAEGNRGTRPEEGRRPGAFRIVTLGRSDLVKGFRDLLEAVAITRRAGRDIDLVVFGTETPLPEHAEAPYRHVGRRVDRDLADLYRSADCVVTPSWYESFPLPPLEAMACGVPVITTRYGTEDYAEDGLNALVVPPREPQRLAGAIARLVESESLRQALAKGGVATARRFTWDDSVATVERIFTNALRMAGAPLAPGDRRDLEPRGQVR